MTTRRQMRCLAATVAIALWALEPRLAAQEQQQLFISFTGPNGTPVTDLQAGDVSVTEDGVPCAIVKLEPINWPIKLHVLVDNGRATTNPINSLREGLRGLFEQIPDGVEISMYTTAGTPRPVVRPTTEKQKLIDGISLIAPDTGAGMFFDALSEAARRIEQDKTPNFPVIVMVGSTVGSGRVSDRDFQRLQETILARAVTAHVVLLSLDGGAGGGGQPEIGQAVTKLSGGHYEGITALTRLASLLPELGRQIAESHLRQSHQYRITYERPANAVDPPRVSAGVRRDGTTTLSRDGHLP